MDSATVLMVTSEVTDFSPTMVSVASRIDFMPYEEINDSLDHSTTIQWNEWSSPKSQPSPKDIIMAEYYPVAVEINRVVPWVCYVIGFFGNTISAVAWFQPRLSKRNSSAIYLALLSISDLVFLVLHCAERINTLLDTQFAAYAWFCEVFFFFFLVPQYLTPLLVLGFTTERYVAVCHPLLRRVLCRTRVAISVSVGMVITSILLALIYPLFWTYSPKVRHCDLRQSIPAIESLWFAWNLIVEFLVFLIVPVATLVLDLLVIRCLWQINNNPLSSIRSRGVPCRESQNETVGKAVGRGGVIRGRIGGRTGKIGVALIEPLNEEAGAGGGGAGEAERMGTGGEGGGFAVANGEMKGSTNGGGRRPARPRLCAIRVPYQATTAMLLAVSLFEIITIVSVSILYLLHDHFRRGPSELSKEEMLADPTWQRYFSYTAAKYIIISLCMTRNAALIFFYMALGPRFRETLWDLIRCRNAPNNRAELTQNTFAGSSLSSVRSQHQVELAVKH